ncbi:MAG TPA: hypothetical protein VGA91_06860 [Candidatus Limnocylindria bacterium]
MTIWSELPRARVGEMLADAATLVWVAVWATLGWRLYMFLADLAGTGRFVAEGGTSLGAAGREVAEAIRGIPLIGEGAADAVGGAFAAAANPLISFGNDLERLLLAIAILLALLLVAAALVPWLNRYLPWRVSRLRRLRAAKRVVRRPPIALEAGQVEHLLASRALHRLEYDELLEFSPDPFGDWVAGRYDRLARAELAEVGLRPSPASQS